MDTTTKSVHTNKPTSVRLLAGVVGANHAMKIGNPQVTDGHPKMFLPAYRCPKILEKHFFAIRQGYGLTK